MSLSIWDQALRANDLQANPSDNEGEPKYSVWSSDLQTVYYDLSGTGNDSFGIHSAAFIAGFSRSRIKDRYILRGGFGFVVGPEDHSTFNEADVFLNGLHFEVSAATSLLKDGFRTPSRSLIVGIQTAISYDELKGKSDRLKSTRDESKIYNFSKQSLEMSIVTTWVGFCLGQWSMPRPDNNKIENLLTRIEGWSVSLDYGIPLITGYRGSFDQEYDDEADVFPPNFTTETLNGDLLGGTARLVIRVDLGG